MSSYDYMTNNAISQDPYDNVGKVRKWGKRSLGISNPISAQQPMSGKAINELLQPDLSQPSAA